MQPLRARNSPSDCWRCGAYHSAEKQLVYSTAPTDWARMGLCYMQNNHFCGVRNHQQGIQSVFLCPVNWTKLCLSDYKASPALSAKTVKYTNKILAVAYVALAEVSSNSCSLTGSLVVRTVRYLLENWTAAVDRRWYYVCCMVIFA